MVDLCHTVYELSVHWRRWLELKGWLLLLISPEAEGVLQQRADCLVQMIAEIDVAA